MLILVYMKSIIYTTSNHITTYALIYGDYGIIRSLVLCFSRVFLAEIRKDASGHGQFQN
ncbi:unnamed protein product, partial [Rotaria sp. Silwood2]